MSIRWIEGVGGGLFVDGEPGTFDMSEVRVYGCCGHDTLMNATPQQRTTRSGAKLLSFQHAPGYRPAPSLGTPRIRSPTAPSWRLGWTAPPPPR